MDVIRRDEACLRCCIPNFRQMCAHKHEYERAMKFAREMEEMDGIKPTLATMEILFRAAAKAPQWLQVRPVIPLAAVSLLLRFLCLL